nr:enoyl-CoA hydratase-related protein [Microbacterium immunditiarum]
MLVRFDHPPTRNALDRASRVRLVECLARADRDPDVRVIIVTGADPAFCSGVDAKQLLGDPDYTPPPVDPATMLRSLSTPTIAAVNGACVSGGLEIALACSMVIASDRARFADTHAVLGLTPGWGLSAELPAAIGAWRARQMSLTGEAIGARTAYEWGLVNEVVRHEDLWTRVREVADAVARLDPRSTANMVRLYREGRAIALEPSLDVERAALSSWTVDRSRAREELSATVGRDSGQRRHATGGDN